jgi:methionyl-tRNA synthetase
VLPVEAAQFEELMGVAPAAPKANSDASALIDGAQFTAVDLRVGVVLSAERVEKSDKLLKLIVDTGAGQRQIIAGIAKHYTPEAITGKRIAFIANLKPAQIMGLTSEGMVLAAQKGKRLVVLTPDGDIPAGAKIA